MKFSEKWLREWVNPALTTDQLVSMLTMAGLEVDSVEPAAGTFSNITVAEILSVESHPDAGRLRVCKVNNGMEELPIVCGASNVRPGLKVALANIGSTLNDIKIKKSKLRGVESFGMICSTSELGLTETSSGIMELPDSAPVGENIQFYLELDDKILDVDLTPNRGDCLSIQGIARDVSALTSEPLKIQNDKEHIVATIDDTFPVQIKSQQDCPRYVGRVIRNINSQAETPIWMQERLRRSGLRAIHPVVDIMNYIMLELGQPLHAFDLQELHDNIVVRLAESEEKITLLNEQEVTLESDTLVIADAEKPLAIAGIMGGKDSGVTENTQHIFLESAYFNPIRISGKARRYNAFSDSAHRFERGVDPHLQAYAIERATELLLEIVGGEPGPISENISKDNLPKLPEINLNSKRIMQYLGIEIADDIVENILTRLHMQVRRLDSEQHSEKHSDESSSWQVNIPSFRFDIKKDVDLIEEIARVYGYQEIPSQYPQKIVNIKQPKETKISVHNVRQRLINNGYHEVINYSFTDPNLQKILDPQQQPLELLNPISPEFSVMRTNLWPGLLNTIIHNQRRQLSRIRVFEIGNGFKKVAGKVQEQQILAGAICGLAYPEQWGTDNRMVDFFDIKGDVEALLQMTFQLEQFKFYAAERAALHPGQSCKITFQDKEIGYLGALHPQIERVLDIKGPVYLFEILLDTFASSKLPKFKPLSKYPSIRRDIAVLVDKLVSAQAVKEVVTLAAGELLTDVSIFDVYAGENIQADKKSLAIALFLQHQERTLVDSEVSELMDNVIICLKKQLDASLRE